MGEESRSDTLVEILLTFDSPRETIDESKVGRWFKNHFGENIEVDMSKICDVCTTELPLHHSSQECNQCDRNYDLCHKCQPKSPLCPFCKKAY